MKKTSFRQYLDKKCLLPSTAFSFSMLFLFNTLLPHRGGPVRPPGYIGMMPSGRHAGLPLR